MSKYQQASPSGGVIFYKINQSGGYQVYLSERRDDKSCSTGRYSIYGGFVECAEIAKTPVGTIQNKFIEIYRECIEEIGDGFNDIVTEIDFIDQAEFVCSQLVRTDDGNMIHDAMLLAFEVTPELEHFFKYVAKLTDEQMPAKPYDVYLSAETSNKPLLPPYDGHELLDSLTFPSLPMQYQHEKAGIALFLRSKNREK